MSQVFHDRDFNPVETRKRVFPDDFVLVAEVNSDSLEEIYRLTNHIDEAWWDNPGVKRIPENPVRSTSTGDLVILSDGRMFVCCTIGWSQIGTMKYGNISANRVSFQVGLFTGLENYKWDLRTTND